MDSGRSRVGMEPIRRPTAGMLRRFRLSAVSERHGKERASEARPPRAALRIVALFALLLGLTLAAAPSAEASAGAFMKAYGWGVLDGMSQFETCTTTCQAGIAGSGAGQLYQPGGVAIDRSGDVYVADFGNERIDEFSAAGAFIKAYGSGVSDGQGNFETCTTTCQIGGQGGASGAGAVDVPEGITIDPSGDVYVADTGNNRVDEFSAAGAFIKAYGWGVSDGQGRFETCTNTCQVGMPGGGAGQINTPNAVATDPSGDVYVADTFNNRVDEFSAAGAFIKAYGWGVSDGQGRFETCTNTCQAGMVGSGAGELGSGAGNEEPPNAVAADASGDVYVADYRNNRIDEFSAAGAFIKAYGWGVSDGASRFETCTSTCQAGIAGRRRRAALRAPRRRHRSLGRRLRRRCPERAGSMSSPPPGAFIEAYGWGVSDGPGRFETCTTCQAGSRAAAAGSSSAPGASLPIARATSTSPITATPDR